MAHAIGIRPQILHWNMTKPIAASLKNPFISALSERPEGAEVLQVAGGVVGTNASRNTSPFAAPHRPAQREVADIPA